MTMNRRQFLKNMGIGAAGAALPGVSMFAANEAMNPSSSSHQPMIQVRNLPFAITILA